VFESDRPLAAGVGSDVERGLAAVGAGGLVPATFLTLFPLPTFYFVIERRVARRAQMTVAQVASTA
jgi:heavy metal efflux system protein